MATYFGPSSDNLGRMSLSQLARPDLGAVPLFCMCIHSSVYLSICSHFTCSFYPFSVFPIFFFPLIFSEGARGPSSREIRGPTGDPAWLIHIKNQRYNSESVVFLLVFFSSNQKSQIVLGSAWSPKETILESVILP